MKALFDYLNAITPVLTDEQRRHIEVVINDMIKSAEMKEYSVGWNEGRAIGFKEGCRQGKMESQPGGRE